MNTFLHLLLHDFRLLFRNQIVTISVVVTLAYVGVFRFLAQFGAVEKLLILIIFNDPALLGFLFVGVMVLFEKNEGTWQALAVTPVRTSQYILSKSIALTIISLLCSCAMVLAAYGWQFHWGYFTLATLLTTLLYSMLGFIAVARQRLFNKYILLAGGLIILLGLPFLGYFGVVSEHWFIVFPTWPAVRLFDLAFQPEPSVMQVLTYSLLTLIWTVGAYFYALRIIHQSRIAL